MSADNITLLDLALGASELNGRLANVAGGYVGFVDEGADYGEGYFDALAEELGQRPDCAYAFGLLKGSNKRKLPAFAGKPKEVTEYDVAEDFTNTLLLPNGILCRAELFQDSAVRFDEGFAYVRDALFALRVSEAGKRGVYCPKSVYLSAMTFDEQSPDTPQASQKDWYWESTLPFVRTIAQDDGTLSEPAQYALLYLTIQRFKSNENTHIKIVFDDLAQTDEYLAQAAEALASITDNVLFQTRVRLWERRKLLYLAQVRQGGMPEFDYRHTRNGKDVRLFIKGSRAKNSICTLGGQTLRVQAMRYCQRGSQAGLEMDLRAETCFPADSFELHLVNTYQGTAEDVTATLTKRMGGMTQYFDRTAYKLNSFSAFVPLKKTRAVQEITAYALFEGKRIDIAKLVPWRGWQSRLVAGDELAYWAIPGAIVRSMPSSITVSPAGPLRKLRAEDAYQKHLIADVKDGKKIAALRKAYFKTRRSYKGRRIWLYSDKGFKGGDNAEYAYRYARTCDDGIEHLYVIDCDTVDGKKLAQEGAHLLDYGSEEAFLAALNAEVVYATHVPPYRKVGFTKNEVEHLKDLMGAKIVRLYHGFPITSDISYTQFYADYAAVAVASRYEAALYTDDDNGFPSDAVIASGMPRYDGLVDASKRQLLFAPTWRPSCRGKVLANGESDYNPDFVNSRYFERYHRIFTDERLLSTARETGYKIKLFLHPRMAPQTVDFEPSDVFQALDCTKDTDYVTIMRESDLMVTDYSSVMVDFAYMRKPVVYYQDQALPYWRMTNFDYRGIGFGEVVEDVDSLVEVLCEYMRSDCALKEMYRQRINEFFYYDDLYGGKRLYEGVKKLTENA